MRRKKIVLYALLGVLCIGAVTVIAVVLVDKTKLNNQVAEETGQTVTPPEDKPISEGSNGRLVLSELELPQIEPKDVTVEYLQEIVRLANEIYKKNDTVVLSDQVITVEHKFEEIKADETTYEEYSRYLQGLYSIVMELIRQSFSSKLLRVDNSFVDSSEPQYQAKVYYLIFDIEESGCKTLEEWLHKLHYSTSGVYPSMGRHLQCTEGKYLYYSVSGFEGTELFPYQDQKAILHKLLR